MMESWPGRHGQYYYYSKFGTVPGRSCTHNYHERHQTPHYPWYYDELQQNRSRESSHWTVPGSRAGAALHEHANWTDTDLTFPSTSPSSHFPFTLDRHPHHHQDVRGYQTHEVPEWTASRPATRDDKGLLREDWQNKWDLSNQVPCNRDILGTRSESNYRELESWATRYRHSLPRRRRIEAELRGASQRTVDNSRTDHQETTMQHTKKSPINKEFGLYPSKAPTSNMMGMKENTGYQRMMFSQPPGYTAPPPYNSQHKVSPVYQYWPSNWEKDDKRPVSSSWSHFSLRMHDGPADNRIGEKEGFKMSDESRGNTKLKGLKAQREDANTLQTGSPISVLNTQRRLEHMLPLQYSSEKPKTIGETLSRVIEGRKFKLEKKTGGMTIFCLVSRMAANTETPSLVYSKTNPESAETEYVPQTQRLREDNTPTHKLADEVDFTASTLTEQTKVSDGKNLSDGQEETSSPANEKQEVDVLSSKTCAHNEAEINRKDEYEQPVSTKYPLWREPRSTNRTEKVNKDFSDGGEHVCDQEVSQPVDSEVSKHDIKDEADDKKGLLVIDTTCVLVKMELIQSPSKEHVLYLGSPGGDHRILLDDQTVESKCPLMETIDEDTQTNPTPEANNNNPTSPGREEHIEEEKEQNVILSPESESETFEERAERILGIPLDLCTKKLEAEDLIAIYDLNAKKEEAGSSEHRVTEEEQSQGHQHVVQSNKPVSLTENTDRVEITGNDGEKALESHSKGAESSGEKETSMDLTHLETTDHSVLESSCNNNNLVENDGEHQTEEDVDECTEMGTLVTAESVFLLQLTSPESLDCSSVSTSHTDSSSSSPPSLDSNSQSGFQVLCDTESQDEELITDSVDTNKTDEVFSISMQQLNDCQPDDAVSDLFEPQSEADGEPKDALKEHFAAAEEEPFSDITLQQLLESVNMDADDDDKPKTSDTTEQQSPTEGFQEPLGILSHCTECGEEEKECEIEVKMCEEKAGNTTANVQSQENHEELLTSHGDSTEAQNNTTAAEADAEHALDLPASDCEESQPTSGELTCPELISQDSVSFLDSAAALPPNPGSACGVPQKDPSLLCEPLHFSVLDQVFCSTSPDEEHTCPDEAHEVLLHHPQSLRDVVSRIRKHTAPDSENEEEEVSEPWDPESLHPALLFTDVLMDCSEHVDEDRLSCSSISSHGSGDTVIVAEETAGCSEEPSEVKTEVEGFDKAEDLCCCGENTAEDKQEENKTTDTSESSLSEECHSKTTREDEKTET